MTKDEFALRLFEQLHMPSFLFGDTEAPEIDSALVLDIAAYLVEEEELFGNIQDHLLYRQAEIRARVTTIGVMIYGWTKYREIQSG